MNTVMEMKKGESIGKNEAKEWIGELEEGKSLPQKNKEKKIMKRGQFKRSLGQHQTFYNLHYYLFPEREEI